MPNPLIKLPPMGRKSSGERKPKTEPIGLIPLPQLVREKEQREDSWGGMEVGRWFDGADGNVGGTCARCRRTVDAKELRWTRWPFTEEEGWACGPCRKEARGLEWSPGMRKKDEHRVATPKSKRVRNASEWVANSRTDPHGWYGPTPYSEERKLALIAHSQWLGWTDEREAREGEWENEGGNAWENGGGANDQE